MCISLVTVHKSGLKALGSAFCGTEGNFQPFRTGNQVSLGFACSLTGTEVGRNILNVSFSCGTWYFFSSVRYLASYKNNLLSTVTDTTTGNYKIQNFLLLQKGGLDTNNLC